MGHFPQDGENEQKIIIFLSLTVTERFDFFKFSQLFWRDFVLYSLKLIFSAILLYL